MCKKQLVEKEVFNKNILDDFSQIIFASESQLQEKLIID